MSIVRETYREVARRKIVAMKCEHCGKPTKRTLKEWQTINPFNLNADGAVKTVAEIVREVDAVLELRADALRERGLVCRSCESDEPHDQQKDG